MGPYYNLLSSQIVLNHKKYPRSYYENMIIKLYALGRITEEEFILLIQLLDQYYEATTPEALNELITEAFAAGKISSEGLGKLITVVESMSFPTTTEK